MMLFSIYILVVICILQVHLSVWPILALCARNQEEIIHSVVIKHLALSSRILIQIFHGIGSSSSHTSTRSQGKYGKGMDNQIFV